MPRLIQPLSLSWDHRVIDGAAAARFNAYFGALLAELGTYEDAADLIQIGAYVAGSDPRVDRARAAMPRIEALIRQPLVEGVPRPEALNALRLTAGVAR